MFTSEPSLAQRIERMIGDVPIVDTRSHLALDRLHAPDLAALLNEPPIRLALGGVGMPLDIFHPDRSVDEQVTLALPFLRQIRNTSAAWCLYRIFRDLYAFDEPHLSLDNYQGLMDTVAQAATEPDRAREILCNRARMSLVVAPLAGKLPEAPAVLPTSPDYLVHRLDLVANDAGDTRADQVKSRVFDQLDADLEGTVRFASFGTIPDVNNVVHAAVLDWHELHEAPIQVVIDPIDPPSDLASQIVAIFARYPKARFGLMTGSTRLGAEVAALAGRYPNAFAEGHAASGAWTAMAESNILSRIQNAAVTKIGGFSSGATSAEWVYGSFQATKKATASALAQAVSGGFFEEDELPPLLRAIFATSPIAWYHLQD